MPALDLSPFTAPQRKVIALYFEHHRARPVFTAEQVRDSAGVGNARAVLHHLAAKGVLVESFEGWGLAPRTREIMELACARTAPAAVPKLGAPSIEELDRHIQQEEDASRERIRQMVRPLIVAEFQRVQRRNAKLRRIIFGNGTYHVDVEGGTYWDADGAPVYAHRLLALCDRVRTIGVDDVQ